MSLIAEMRQLTPMMLRLLAIKFFTYLGMIASYFVGILGTLTYEAQGDALASTLAVGLLNAAMIVGVFIAGALLDRMGPKKHLQFHVACVVASCLIFIALAGSICGIITGAALFGFAWGTSDPIVRAYPAYLTEDLAELKTLNAAINTAISVAVIIGPLIGSAISLVAPTWTVLIFCMACALVGLSLGAGFTPVRDPRIERARNECGKSEHEKSDSPFAGFRSVGTSTTLSLLVGAGFLVFFAYGAFDPLESLYYRDVLCVGAEWMGILSSASGVGAILGAILLMRLPARMVHLRTLMWCFELCGVGCLVYVGTDILLVALVGQILVGAAVGAFSPLQTTLVQVHAPLDEVGRVSAAVGFTYQAAGVVPLLLTPALSAVLGVQGTLIASALCSSAVPLVLMIVLREHIQTSVEEEQRLGIHMED